MRSKERAVEWATGLFRFVMGLGPKGWPPYPEETLAAFRAGLGDAQKRRGLGGYVWFFCGAMVDLLAGVASGYVRATAGRLGRGLGPTVALRQTVRSLLKTWGVSGTAVGTLSLGIGLALTGYAAVHGVALRDLPFADPEKLVAIELVSQDPEVPSPEFEALELRDFRAAQSGFADVEGYYRRRATIDGMDGQALDVGAGVVTAGALRTLGVAPLLGRTFRDGEDFTSDVGQVVLAHHLWVRDFGSDSLLVGRQIVVDGGSVEVIGIMPEGFQFPVAEDLWLPMDFALPTVDRGSGRSFSVFGRLAPGTTFAQGEAEAAGVARGIGEQNPDFLPPLSAGLMRFRDRHLPPGLNAMLGAVAAAIAAVLLVALLNVSSLLMVRVVEQRPEYETRRALGASRAKLATRPLGEALLLAMVSALVGWGLAVVAEPYLASVVPDVGFPYWVDLSLPWHTPLLLIAVIGVVVLVAGGLPALMVQRTVKDSRNLRVGTGRGVQMGRSGITLVVGQIALSFALLVGAGLLVRSIQDLRSLDLGFEPEAVLTAQIRLPEHSIPRDQRSDVFTRITAGASEYATIASATVARVSPGTGPTFTWPFAVVGEQRPGSALPRANGVPVGAGYFTTLGTPLVAGREFSPEESRFGREPVLIVNRALADRYLGSDALGRGIDIGGEGGQGLLVVGVVEDSFIGSGSGGFGLDAEISEPQIYLSWSAAPYRLATLLVKTTGDLDAAASDLHTLFGRLAPEATLYDIAPLESEMRESTWAFRFFGGSFGLFGILGLIMASVGLFGLMAYTVRQRTREMSVRMALGARPEDLRSLILARAGMMLAVGVSVGVLLSVFVARGLSSLVVSGEPFDLLLLASVALLFALVVLVATLVPALRAGRADPAQSLRGST